MPGVPPGPCIAVGERTVKGWWKDDDHARGVPGTYGNGYEGVRKGWANGVAVALPRTVREDEEVDSVEDEAVVASGLLKAELMGERADSSLVGIGLFGCALDGLLGCDVFAGETFCCLASMRLWTAARRRAISSSSGLLTTEVPPPVPDLDGPGDAAASPMSSCFVLLPMFCLEVTSVSLLERDTLGEERFKAGR